ncbi:MAG: DnaD domain protein, partial [Clostridia bacterium]|nr:DnaD domain protein [Clostridia bacterium]
RFRDSEYKIRRLLGLGERALTAKEKEYIETWTAVYAMPMDVITRAYEITVKNIDTPRMSYINKILSGWNENGIRTIEAVDAAEAEFERKKAGNAGAAQTGKDTGTTQSASYDIDTFLELAMNRSFEDTD